jgi:RNA polymerase sigma-70 factor (ECF subfamily)
MSLSADAEDWVGVLAGDGQAFGRVFDRHREAVRRCAHRLVTSPGDAEDVLAVVFLEAWRRREAVRFVDGSILPWLLVTTTHAAQNLRRGARRYRALLDRLPPPEAAPDHADRFDTGAATAALRRLPRADQEVLALCVLEELSEREAAAALRVRPGTVKSRLFRAKARLLRAMGTDRVPPFAEEASHGL